MHKRNLILRIFIKINKIICNANLRYIDLPILILFLVGSPFNWNFYFFGIGYILKTVIEGNILEYLKQKELSCE